MREGQSAALQAAFFREVLTADVAVAMGLVPTSVAAAHLARFWEADDVTVLGGGAVSAADRARVEAKVAKLIAEADGDERAALARRGVARELPSQLEPETAYALSESGARLRAPLRSLDKDRYMGFLPLGEGGMGVVYLALDTELNRRVAFKMIRAGARDPLAEESGPVSDDAAARFVQEAVVTGGLEHPGIVPVYELGSTPAGVPYYTMRVVRGERTLSDAIADATTLEQRLNLLEPFLKICDAVGYAHSRGVIHRDLKPANVALGPYGEVVVLDWGLAKMRSRPDIAGTRWQSRVANLRVESDLKTLTSALGTPGFMAPEAALGRVDEVDERSDVYSLGAILHRVLTGEFPFSFSTFAEYLTGIRKGVTEVTGAPAGLAAICAKALSPERGDRHQDVGELAAAIRTWMTESTVEREVDGLLKEAETALGVAEGMEGDALLRQLDRANVIAAQILDLRPSHAQAAVVCERARELRDVAIAQRESVARRRLMRRVGVVGLLAATAATVVVALLLDGKRREAEGARVREAEQRQVAEDERARAEEMARFMLTDLHEGLQPIGRLDLLGPVASKSFEYYESLPDDRVTADVRRSRALALGQVSEVMLYSGDLDRALEAARESQRVFEELVRTDPVNTEWQEDLASAFNRTGDVLQEIGQLDAALASYRHSATLRRELAPIDLARSLDRVGAVLNRKGERSGALAAYEESLKIRRRLVAQDPPDAAALEGLSISLGNVGDLALQSLGLRAALEYYEEALETRRRLVDAGGASPLRESQLAGTVFRVAYCRNEQGDQAGARAGYEEALTVYRRLSAADPADALLQRNVALSLEALGGLLTRAGDVEGALSRYREALALQRGLAARDAAATRPRHDVAKALLHVGDVAKDQGDLAVALENYEEALAIARVLVTEDEVNAEWKDDLAMALFRIGQAHEIAKRLPDARAAFEESLGVARRLTEADPAHGDRQRNLGLTLLRLGDVAAAEGDSTQAREHYTASAEIARRLAERDETSLYCRKDLAWVLGRLASVVRAHGDADRALALYEEALPLQRRVAAAEPTPLQLRELSLCLYNIALLHDAAGRPEDALFGVREAEAVHRGAAGYAGEHHYWSAALGRLALAVGPQEPRDHLEAAYLLYEQGEYARSAEHFSESFEDEAIATDLTRGNRYNAACSATLAGQYERALKWLAEDFELRREKMPADQFAAHREHARVKDPDLALLRDLPEFTALFAKGD